MFKRFLLSTVLFLAACAGAVPLGDFSSTAPWTVNDSEKRNQCMTLQTLPESGEKGVKLSWDGYAFPYAELHLRTPLPLPADFRRGNVSLRLRLPARAPVRSISLRLVDATGEIFQYQLRCLPPAEPKILTVDYPVNLMENKNSSWGGNNDKKFDLPVALKGFTIDFERESGAGEALFLGAEAIPENTVPSAADNIRLEIETGNPVHVLTPGKADRLRLVLRNAGDARFRGKAEAVFEDFFGRTFSEKLPSVELAAGETMTCPVRTPLPAPGHWDVRLRLFPEGGGEVTKKRSFAGFKPAGPTPGKAEGFLWGISSHPQLHPAPVQKLEALAAALVGAKVVREDVYWHRVQPARGQWDFRSFDQTVAIFAEQGIELQAILCYCAPWAARDPGAKRPEKAEPEPEAWKTFCREMAKRYRGRVRFWEVWNEPDVTPFSGFSSASYAKMMLNAYKAVKTGNPDARVLTGGFATLANHPMLREPGYQENALRLGKGGYDIHAYHEHGDFHPHFVRMVEERFLPMRKRAGVTEPWWANETALTSSGGNEKPQAMALYKKLIYAWSRGAVGYNWYDLRNDGDDPNHGEHNYGMMTRDFYPKPVYTVYNTLTTLFGGKKFVRQLNAGEGEWLFLFRDGEEMALAAWSENGGIPPVIVRTDAASAEAVDLMNNPRPVEIHDGRILLETGSLPVTLRLRGATRAEFAGNPVRLESADLALPGKPYRFAAGLTNPFDKPVEFVLEFRAPAGFRPEKTERRLTVPAGKTAAPVCELRADENFRPVFGTPVTLTADYRLSGGAVKGSVSMPVRVAQVIPQGATTGRPPDFTLEHRRQVRELFTGDPTRGHLLWKGPRDLSGRVSLGTEGANLLLQVRVTDNIHHQPERGANAWMGDNIQFALELPGRKGGWELGLTRLADGSPEVWCWSAPDGFDPAAAARGIVLATSREESETVYCAKIPFETLGLTPELLKEGFRFNLLINDNDGGGRQGWISIAPGIGERKDPSQFPFVIFN